jgi:hypothetical protein
VDPRLTRLTASLLVFFVLAVAVIDAVALNPSWTALLRKYPYPTAIGVAAVAGLIAAGLAAAWPRVRAALGPWIGSARSAVTDPRVRAGRLPLEVAVPALLLLILVVVLVAIITRDALWTTGTAAVATMVVLAYQGWQVQESTAVGAQAAVIGQAAGIEAEKRRLDNRAPRIHVSVGEPAWPPGGKRPVTVALGAGSPPERLETVVPGSDPERLDEGRVFRLPRDASDPVSLWVEGEVLNEGTQIVQIQLRDLRISQLVPGGTNPETEVRTPWTEPGTVRGQLRPGRRAFFRLEGVRPVSDWVANHRALRVQGSDESATAGVEDRALTALIKGEVEVDDGFDNGVTDTWQITLTGFPLQPVPEEDASWQVGRRLTEQPRLMAELSQLQRTYWRSKQRRLELPSLEV